MQVFSSYFFCVKFLSVVILCSQNVVADAENSDTVTIPTASDLINSKENSDTTGLSTTVVLNAATSTSISSPTTETPTITFENITNKPFTTPTSENTLLRNVTYTAPATPTLFTLVENLSTSTGKNITPVTSTTTEIVTTDKPLTTSTTSQTTITPLIGTTDNVTTTTQAANVSTTEEPRTLTSTTTDIVTTTRPLTTSTISVSITTPLISTTENVITSTQPGTVSTTEEPSTPLTTSTTSASTTTLLPLTTENVTTTQLANVTTTDEPYTPLTTSTTSESTTTHLSSTTENVTTTQPSNVTTTEEPCTPLYSVNLTIIKLLKTEVFVSVAGLSTGSICFAQIVINCSATGNNTWPWVVQSQNVSFELNDTNYKDVVIGNLSEFTNYTCDVLSDGLSVYQFSFQTDQDALTTSTTSESTTTPLPSTTENVTTTQPPNVTTTEEPCTPLYSVNLTIIKLLKTEVFVSVAGLSTGSICFAQIVINCSATGNNTWPWVVQSQNVSFELNDTNYKDVVIGNLSEFTNYTCDVLSDGLSVYQFPFQTDQDVASSPVDLNITTTSTSLNISWQVPEKIPSILEKYEVTIIRKNVASEGHFWNNCSDNDTYSINVTEISFHFNNALPDFVYDISVVAISNVGYGDAANCTGNTIAAASDPPVNVSNYLIEKENNNNNNIKMTQNISWVMPCNTHGPVSHFLVELDGYYLYNQSRTDVRNFTIPIFKNQITYFGYFLDIWAASRYTYKIYLVGDMSGMAFEDFYYTDDNYPSAPKLNTIAVTSQNLSITWIEPDNYPGKIIDYLLYIVGAGINWSKTQYCNVIEYNETQIMQDAEYFTSEIIPYSTYNIYIFGRTSRGEGNMTGLTVTSNMTYPDPLSILSHNITTDHKNEKYNAYVTIHFLSGCFNGEFNSYIVSFVGSRTGYDDHSYTKELKDYTIDTYIFDLRPEHMYITTVTIKNAEYSEIGGKVNFTAPAGVPTVNRSIISSIPITIKDTQVSLTLKKKDFSESQGSLKYIAIIVSNENITAGSFNRWKNHSQWPIPKESSGIYYQATPKFWEPFLGNDTIEYTIGNNISCNKDEQYCNQPLESNTRYFIFLRLFNDDYYRNTMPITFVTDQTSRLAMILGLLGGLLFVALNGFIVFVLWRKGCIKVKQESQGYREAVEDSSDPLLLNSEDRLTFQRFPRTTNEDPRTDISKNRFISYCTHLEQNPNVLTAQWKELEDKSKIIYDELPHHFATLPENKRKNRYTNILPFDHSRVKLNIDEDDEISSDYINASLIKGVSGQNEYIATQGPLSGTCRDFWKMVLQEHVSIIVMVSRLIESNREKCYKYFPNNRETMTIIGDDIEVRCSMELHFGFYCIRTLQVKKELAQVTVTQMQFMEWPDFGVPTGTESMLNFCHQFQERWTNERGIALVHCSAGVGRTGTLIATDILLRALAAGRKIDVFNTVLELRRQRQNMVQTEKQYMYIYQLIKSMIEFPIVDERGNDDHLYENVDPRTRNGIVESSF